MMKFLLLFFSLCCMVFNGQAQSDSSNIYSYQNSLSFADYLISSGNYADAATEYERLIFLNNIDEDLKYNLVLAYRKSNQLELAYKNYIRFFPDPVAKSVPLRFSQELYKTLLMARDFSGAYTFSQQSNSFSESEKRNNQLITLLLQKKWVEAESFALENKGYELNNEMLAFSNQAMSLKYKSPVLAACLSGIIPGSGKFYTGRTADGILALIFVGANAFAAYRGFSQNGITSGYGWLFAGLGTAYYVSNIYGSYQSAIDYNNKLNNGIQQKVEQKALGNL